MHRVLFALLSLDREISQRMLVIKDVFHFLTSHSPRFWIQVGVSLLSLTQVLKNLIPLVVTSNFAPIYSFAELKTLQTLHRCCWNSQTRHWLSRSHLIVFRLFSFLGLIHTYLSSHHCVWCLAQFLSSADDPLYLLLVSFCCWYNQFVARVRQGFIRLSTQSCHHFQALYVFLGHIYLHCWETFANFWVVNRRNNCLMAFSLFLNALVHLIWLAMHH